MEFAALYAVEGGKVFGENVTDKNPPTGKMPAGGFLFIWAKRV